VRERASIPTEMPTPVDGVVTMVLAPHTAPAARTSPPPLAGSLRTRHHDKQIVDVLLTAFSVITPLLGCAIGWIATMGGLRSLSSWLSTHEEQTKNDAISRIKKGLTATQPDADASECVNELVAGLDQWQMARQRTNARIAGLRRSFVACCFFPVFLGGGWLSAKISDPSTGFAQTLLVLCVLALLLIVVYGYPLFRLIMENGLPSKEALPGKTQVVPPSNTVSANEAATTQSLEWDPRSPAIQQPESTASVIASAVHTGKGQIIVASNIQAAEATPTPSIKTNVPNPSSQVAQGIGPVDQPKENSGHGSSRKRRRSPSSV